jgi:hypothetical protein
MITLCFDELDLPLDEENESLVKDLLSSWPRDTKVTILETGEVLQINDIFNYE